MQLSQAELSSELDSQREELHRLTQQINTTEQHLNQVCYKVCWTPLIGLPLVAVAV